MLDALSTGVCTADKDAGGSGWPVCDSMNELEFGGGVSFGFDAGGGLG